MTNTALLCLLANGRSVVPEIPRPATTFPPPLRRFLHWMWSTAIPLGVFIGNGVAVRAQTVTYNYNGNAFDSSLCRATAQLTCASGNVSGSVTFNSLPANYTGLVAPPSSYCNSGYAAPCIQTIYLSGAGSTLSYPNSQVLPPLVYWYPLGAQFYFQNGVITAWNVELHVSYSCTGTSGQPDFCPDDTDIFTFCSATSYNSIVGPYPCSQNTGQLPLIGDQANTVIGYQSSTAHGIYGSVNNNPGIWTLASTAPQSLLITSPSDNVKPQSQFVAVTGMTNPGDTVTFLVD